MEIIYNNLYGKLDFDSKRKLVRRENDVSNPIS